MRLGMACVLALAAALAAPGASALGDERGPGGGGTHHAKFWRRDKIRHQLRLTDDEIDKLEDILARNRQRVEDMKADVKKKHATLDAPPTDEAREKERMLRGLLRGPAPDAAAIGALVIELDACCKKIERIRRTTRASFRRTRPSSPPASLVERSTARVLAVRGAFHAATTQ